MTKKIVKYIILSLIFVSFADIIYANGLNIKFFTLYRNKMVLVARDDFHVPIATMSVSCSNVETPLGDFRVDGQKLRWHTVWGVSNYVQYAVRIDKHILFHSVCYGKRGDPTSLKVDTYNDIIDMRESQGCIRMRTEDAKWVYDNISNVARINIIDTDENIPRPKYFYMFPESVALTTNDFKNTYLINSPQLATYLKLYPENNGLSKRIAFDESGNAVYGELLSMPGSDEKYFMTGDLNEGNVGFLANCWLNVGDGLKGTRYHFNSQGLSDRCIE